MLAVSVPLPFMDSFYIVLLLLWFLIMFGNALVQSITHIMLFTLETDDEKKDAQTEDVIVAYCERPNSKKKPNDGNVFGALIALSQR